MTLAAQSECAAIPGPIWPDVNDIIGKRAHFWRAGAIVFAAVLVSAMLAGPVTAQQTIVIGDNKPNANVRGPGALGASGAPGTAYRLPGSGQLVINRPSTLLFPPSTFPSSRLTVPVPPGHVAHAATAPDTGKMQSRLLVPKPDAPQMTQPEPTTLVATAVPREPVIEAVEPAPAPTIAPVAEPTPPPVAPIAPKTEPIAPAAPATIASLPREPEPAAEPPSAPSLTEQLLSAPPPAEPSAPAPVVEPAPEPMAEPEPAPSQSAALPSATSPVSEMRPISEMRLVFSDGSADLTAAATGQLDGMAKELLSNAGTRVQLLAFAKASAESSSRARRLSLSRALAVRAYLIEKGIRSTRMDVRALGSGFEDGPPDRVDVLPQKSSQ